MPDLAYIALVVRDDDEAFVFDLVEDARQPDQDKRRGFPQLLGVRIGHPLLAVLMPFHADGAVT